MDRELYELQGKSVLVIGGAYSVDKNYRIANGLPWFFSEQPDEITKQQAESKLDSVSWCVDYIFSHTCPKKFDPSEFYLPTIDQELVDKTAELWLDKIEDRLDYDRWFFGHFHCNQNIGKAAAMISEIEELKTCIME